jgi:hypothetical protein
VGADERRQAPGTECAAPGARIRGRGRSDAPGGGRAAGAGGADGRLGRNGNDAARLTTSHETDLEAAYYSGFSEWPRKSSGEAVADSLDVAPPTVHQHLRTAERKLLAALLEGEPTDAG